MYYYNVVDDVVVKRSFRYRKMCTDEELAKQIAEKIPNSKVMYLQEECSEESLYRACCELTEYSEEAATCNWFVSTTCSNILALALLCVIENYHLWKVLMDENDFNEWIQRSVR